jgi:hypothetical protein
MFGRMTGGKKSYFYSFKPFKGALVCEEKLGYACFEEQSHSLYIKSSRSNREGGGNFGYWRQVE